jgi:hypothetical protein
MRRAAPLLLIAVLALAAATPASAKKKAPASTAISSTPLAPGGQVSATARCPKGSHVTGGGWLDSAPYSANGTETLGDDSGLRMIHLQSQPAGLTTWTAGAAAFTVPGTTGTYSSFARCERKSISRIAVTTPHTEVIPPSSQKTTGLACPKGTHVLSGGFSISPPGNLADPAAFRPKVAQSQRVSSTTWAFDLVNPTGFTSAVTFVTTVECELNQKGLNLTEQSSTVPLVDNSRATTTASCVGKTHTVSAGFLLTPTVGPAVGIDQFGPTGQKSWQVGAYEYPGFTLPGGATISVFAYCRKNH